MMSVGTGKLRRSRLRQAAVSSGRWGICDIRTLNSCEFSYGAYGARSIRLTAFGVWSILGR